MKQARNKEEHPAPVMRESFIAANGYNGFRSRYDEVYRDGNFDRLFVIAGGPGTGKSHMMNEVSLAAKNAGADVERIYCSSDPSSLDGVIMEKNGRRVAILDGTAPHRRSADLPVARDELIDLGEFWNRGALQKEKNNILALAKEKSDAYARAYCYLSIAGKATALLLKTLEDCINLEKMERSVNREIKRLSKSENPKSETRYISAFGMRGYKRLSFRENVKSVISVSDEYGSATIYLSFLEKRIRQAGCYDFCELPSCFSDEETEGVILPRNNLLFLKSAEGADRKINMRRFLDTKAIARNRRDIRCALRVRSQMLDGAQNSMHAVEKAHFALEKIYGAAMDFEKKEECARRTVERVLSCLDS